MFVRILLVGALLGLSLGDVDVVRKTTVDNMGTIKVTHANVKRHNSGVVRNQKAAITVGEEGEVEDATESEEDAELAEDLAILESILEESKHWDVDEDENVGSLAEMGSQMKDGDMCGCFPGSAEVRLENGSSKKVSALQQGDMVQTFLEDGSVSYSPFVLDFHEANTVKAEFVEISTDSGKPLRATPNHLVYTSSGTFVRAAEVKVGDELLSFEENSKAGITAKVVDVRMVEDISIFSPLTDSGQLVVDGYAVSSYSLRDTEVAAMRMAFGASVDVHKVSHAMELPVLAFYRSGIPQMAASVCNMVLGASWCNMGPSPTDVAWTWNIRIVSDGLVPTLKQIF